MQVPRPSSPALTLPHPHRPEKEQQGGHGAGRVQAIEHRGLGWRLGLQTDLHTQGLARVRRHESGTQPQEQPGMPRLLGRRKKLGIQHGGAETWGSLPGSIPWGRKGPKGRRRARQDSEPRKRLASCQVVSNLGRPHSQT